MTNETNNIQHDIKAKIKELNPHLTDADDIELERYIKAVNSYNTAQRILDKITFEMEITNDIDQRHKLSVSAKNANGIIAVNSKEANAMAKALCITPETRPDLETDDRNSDDFLD